MEKIPYLDYFRLKEAPFAITPDPEFLFLSLTHRCVIESICHGIRTGAGFLLLTGETGTGKTLATRVIIRQLAAVASIVSIINPSLSGPELIEAILDDLGVEHPAGATKKNLILRLNEFLLAAPAGRPTVIIIDDAQTMPAESLEDLRLLSNLETDKQKLLHIVLIGHPELLDAISTMALRQLKQRISVHCHLRHLSRQETKNYIQRRLFVAGSQGTIVFSHWAAWFIYLISQGVPRNINKICDYALMAGFVGDASVITVAHVRSARHDLRQILPVATVRTFPRARSFFVVACGVLAAAAVFIFFPRALKKDAAVKAPEHFAAAVSGHGVAGGRAPLPPSSAIVPPSASAPPPVRPLPVQGKKAADVYPRKSYAKTAAPNVTDDAALAAPSDLSDQSGPAYTIQMASFVSEQEARAEAARFGRMGIVAHLQQKGRWFRLLAGSFSSRDEARKTGEAHGLAKPVVYFTEDARIAAATDFPSKRVQP